MISPKLSEEEQHATGPYEVSFYVKREARDYGEHQSTADVWVVDEKIWRDFRTIYFLHSVKVNVAAVYE